VTRLEKFGDYRFRVVKEPPGGPPCVVYATPDLLPAGEDGAVRQLVNVSRLPGLVGPAIAMPDIHWGYGFPIGGVAAFDVKRGVVSPGGVGYDINCGVRLCMTDRSRAEFEGRAADARRVAEGDPVWPRTPSRFRPADRTCSTSRPAPSGCGEGMLRRADLDRPRMPAFLPPTPTCFEAGVGARRRPAPHAGSETIS
jgi:hypothetical protein